VSAHAIACEQKIETAINLKFDFILHPSLKRAQYRVPVSRILISGLHPITFGQFMSCNSQAFKVVLLKPTDY
jgi:hypothetical protein